ncbi:hypothetical protein M9458_055257 [Cirrhinus mrigala]|uniref:Integrase catalytic domain-containing protein n=1 Tax=Cirrhinus mrigala TaxID=683832 RepID=A0ABD0MKN0_CIRMR
MLLYLSQKRKEAAAVFPQHPKTQEALDNHMIKVKSQLGAQTLSVEDLVLAEESLVRYVQQQSFQDEITLLNKGHAVKTSSRIYKLDPILDNGILRVGGRLSRMAMPEEFKHPAILPSESHLCRLLMDHIHKMSGHCGRSQLLAKLHKRYWITRGNVTVRKVIRDCLFCRRWHGSALEQKMADLPLNRITPDLPPFSHVGIDYFGPIEVKRGRAHVKRYRVIFTCFNSRAVHLEMAYSLNTDSCICALRRFMCRRGQVKEFISDNGTNFIGAERELREAFADIIQDKIQKAMLRENVKWTFNPPLGSHHGGVWEQIIRILKKILCSILRQQTLDDEGLQTALCEVEVILNDHPIITVSEDSKDPEALTLNHLLQLKGIPDLPPGIFQKDNIYSRRRWKQVQYICDLFLEMMG